MRNILCLSIFLLGTVNNLNAVDHNAHSNINNEAMALSICPGVCESYGGWNGNWACAVDSPCVCGCYE